jgi:RND family efflux transporter MFP subunit
MNEGYTSMTPIASPSNPSSSLSPAPSTIIDVSRPATAALLRVRQSQPFRPSWKIGTTAVGVVLVVAVLVYWFWPVGEEQNILTATVARANLPITVTDRGELESSHTVDGRCEVEGYQNKIVTIVPEGIRVKKGDVVVTFDADQLSRQYADQEVKWRTADGKAKSAKGDLEVAINKAEGDTAKAARDLELAGLDRDKYPAEYRADYEEKRGDIEVAKKELHEAQEKLAHSKAQVKKGYEAPEQLRAKELDVARAMYLLASKEAKLLVLEKWTRQKTEAELKGKAEDAAREVERSKKSGAASVAKAKSDLEAAEITARLEKTSLDRAKRQLDRCTIRAPEDGIVVYSHERYWDPSMQVQPGAMCHYQQIIFSLPDLTKMQVKVNIHEAVVKKIKVGQKVELRVDAYPNAILHGKVKSVATLAQNAVFWNRTGVKEYTTVVSVDDIPPDAGLKPGMTAEVKIAVADIPDVLLAPVQAVSETNGKHVAYVRAAKAIDRREVTVGENNEKFVEIKSGLAEGDAVALDARARVAAEEKANEAKLPANKVKKKGQETAAATPAPPAPASKPAAAPAP